MYLTVCFLSFVNNNILESMILAIKSIFPKGSKIASDKSAFHFFTQLVTQENRVKIVWQLTVLIFVIVKSWPYFVYLSDVGR